MLKNFETELDAPGVTQIRTVLVRDHTVVRSTDGRAHIAAAETSSWTWRELRDYVVGGIESRFGAVRTEDAKWEAKQASIFRSFINRYGIEAAATIAHYAIETCDARWQGRPISVISFCKGSDPYFAQPIAERLNLA